MQAAHSPPDSACTSPPACAACRWPAASATPPPLPPPSQPCPLSPRVQLPHMARGSSIVNSTSVTAYQGSPSLLAYRQAPGTLLSAGPGWGSRQPNTVHRWLSAHRPASSACTAALLAAASGGPMPATVCGLPGPAPTGMAPACQLAGSVCSCHAPWSPCSATKGAIVSFTRSLAAQLAPKASAPPRRGCAPPEGPALCLHAPLEVPIGWCRPCESAGRSWTLAFRQGSCSHSGCPPSLPPAWRLCRQPPTPRLPCCRASV